ncbi:alpha-glycosidase [Paenibacillus sp. 481]|uniref:alpha-glycosidase n=1 Tax=Paenibacillus sp. 481 TaxID=2835869 RepID=UPI001E6269A0|nr:alpha-glycosidase [Paenibacillus sp. 481]UHA72310.1 alpha-glycosidase [Paenibacillus sp. 481]
MLLEAMYHRPKLNWSYAYDRETIHLRLRTKKDDAASVQVIYGDKFNVGTEEQSNMLTAEMTIRYQDEMFDYWQAEVQPKFRRLAYCFQITGSKTDTGSSQNAGKAGKTGRSRKAVQETVWMNEQGFCTEKPNPCHGFFEYPFLNPADVFTPPAWVKDAVFYQIFPERFANGDPSNDPEGVQPWGGEPKWDNYFGGDLQGVMDHLEHLTDLGVNAIYFTPVFAAQTNHKYDTEDYLQVDAHFGDNETLKKLVAECHKRGIRVLLDAVFNHCGRTFPPFVDVLERGADSPYADWFHVREWPLQVKDEVPTYDTFAFVPSMPKLNTEHPDVQKYLLNVAEYWIKEVGIDGWRLDVANEVDHQFWREFRKTVKAANPDAYILGEIFHESVMWLMGDQFDAVMNYPFTWAVHEFLAKEKSDGKQFATAIQKQLVGYPQQANEVMFNLLGSHDTERLLTFCGGDKRKMKLAALFQLTFLGTPCIYYGDEIGLDGGHDPGCRKCMEWDESKQDRDLHAFYRWAIGLRREYAALRTGEFRFLYAKEGDTRLAYERVDEGSHFVVTMNPKKTKRTLTVALPAGRWLDESTGEQLIVVEGQKAKLELPPYGYQVLRKL